MPNFDPNAWLQLGIAGAALFSLLMIAVLFVRSLNSLTSRHDESQKDTNARWSQVVDDIATKHDDTQKETNTVLREFATLMRGIEVKIDNNNHNNNEKGQAA